MPGWWKREEIIQLNRQCFCQRSVFPPVVCQRRWRGEWRGRSTGWRKWQPLLLIHSGSCTRKRSSFHEYSYQKLFTSPMTTGIASRKKTMVTMTVRWTKFVQLWKWSRHSAVYEHIQLYQDTHKMYLHTECIPPPLSLSLPSTSSRVNHTHTHTRTRTHTHTHTHMQH